MSASETVVLEATAVTHYSQLDDDAFFAWLDRIGGVDSYRGERATLYITVTLDELDEAALNEFVALYRRYNIDPRELRVFNAGKLGSWFSSTERYWHPEIFAGVSAEDPESARGPQLGRDIGFAGDCDRHWELGGIATHRKAYPTDTDLQVAATANAVLKAVGVTYYSPLDESTFFETLDRIGCVVSHWGRGDTLYIGVRIEYTQMSDNAVAANEDKWALGDLVGLYRRYGMDVRELRTLGAGTFGPWFTSPDRYWHDDLFG